MRDSVVIYKSFHQASKMLKPEEYKELWVALFEYALEDIEPEDIESALAEAILTMALPQIDANKKKHTDGCKGGAPKGNQNARKQPKQPPVELENNQWLKEKQPNENENENENENVNEKKKRTRTPKEEKHLHGEYKHVRLTDAEFERLATDYGEATRAAAIKRLDEYIQEKPTYKSQDHNLAIRRWVIKALEEDKQKQTKTKASSFHEYSNKNDYSLDAIEDLLLGRE